MSRRNARSKEAVCALPPGKSSPFRSRGLGRSRQRWPTAPTARLLRRRAVGPSRSLQDLPPCRPVRTTEAPPLPKPLQNNPRLPAASIPIRSRSRVDPRGSPLQPPSQRLHRHPGEQRRVRHFPGGRFPAGSLVASRGGQPDRALRPDQATKAGILGLTRGVAREGLPACNATCPGATLTPNAKQQLQQRIAASGQGGDDVMAEPLLFLCGRAARKMAGTPSSSMAAGWRTGMEANHGRPA